MKYRAVKPFTTARHRYAAGAEIEMEDLVGAPSAEERIAAGLIELVADDPAPPPAADHSAA